MSHSKSDSKPPLEVVSIRIIRHKTVSKMAERGRTWSEDEIRVTRRYSANLAMPTEMKPCTRRSSMNCQRRDIVEVRSNAAIKSSS